MKNILFLVLIFFSLTGHSINVDLYGDEDQLKAAEIIKKYSKDLEELAALKLKAMNKPNQQGLKESFSQLKRQLSQQIQKEYHYLYVDLSQVYYPDKKMFYVTVEVVKPNDASRLRFVTQKPYKSTLTKKPKNQELFNDMQNFQDKVLELVMKNLISSAVTDCPFYHCMVNFEHEDLKPYLKKFQEASVDPKKKSLVVQALKEDSPRELRHTAAFLVGHFQDPEEIYATLSPYVFDEDEGMRNNVIRVLIFTLMKSKKTNIDPAPYIALLDSPLGTDRNKALFLLYQLSADDKAKTALRSYALKLVSLAALKQPNNHQPAYEILKQISQKDFGENNMRAWANWAKREAKNFHQTIQFLKK